MEEVEALRMEVEWVEETLGEEGVRLMPGQDRGGAWRGGWGAGGPMTRP